LRSEDIAPSFFTSAPDGGEWSASHPGRFNPRAPGTHLIGDWMDPRFGLDDVEKEIYLFLFLKEKACDVMDCTELSSNRIRREAGSCKYSISIKDYQYFCHLTKLKFLKRGTALGVRLILDAPFKISYAV
jgi:hypothetical protein